MNSQVTEEMLIAAVRAFRVPDQMANIARRNGKTAAALRLAIEAALAVQPEPAVKLFVPNPCSVCGGPIYGGPVRGTGDGSMVDGGSFAHDSCYWRQLAGEWEARAKSGEATMNLSVAVDSGVVHRALDAYMDRLSGVRGHVSNGDELDAMRAALASAGEARHAQAVEAVDPTLITELSELVTEAGERDEGFSAYTFLRDRGSELLAALVHPRPTGDDHRKAWLAVVDTLNVTSSDWCCDGDDPIHAACEAIRQLAAPTGEQAGEVVPYTAEVVAEVVRGDDGQNKLSFVIEGAEAALEVGETLYMIAGLPIPDDGAVVVYLAQPRPMGVPDGLEDANNPWRRAIEHAGYLVTAAERYLEAEGMVNIAIEQVENVDEPDDEAISELESAQEDADEQRKAIRDGIYEFTKRRDRALATLAAAPAPGKGGEA